MMMSSKMSVGCFVLRRFLSESSLSVPCHRWCTFASKSRLGYSLMNYHSSAIVCAKEGRRVTKGSNSKQENGSVLMQFVEKKEEPKAVTVGAKGAVLTGLVPSKVS